MPSLDRIRHFHLTSTARGLQMTLVARFNTRVCYSSDRRHGFTPSYSLVESTEVLSLTTSNSEYCFSILLPSMFHHETDPFLTLHKWSHLTDLLR
jgi:hypothetical protein